MDEVDKSNDVSFEPMDVDLSGNSASIMDISSNSSDSTPRGNDKYRQSHSRKTPNQNPEQKNPLDSIADDKPIKIEKEKKSGYPQGPPGWVTPNLNLIVRNSVDNSLELDKPIKLEKEKASATFIKKYHIKRGEQKVQKSTSFFKIFQLSSIFLGIAILLVSINNLKCSGELDLASLKKNLTKNLVGQKFAVDDIVDALSVEANSKILFLYGGTGVGKTFAVSFILNSLLPSSNTYHYTMPTFVNIFPNELMLGLTMCQNSLIVLDDLTGNHDAIIKSHIRNVIEKSENLAKNITVILIFNCDVIQKDLVKKCDLSFEANLQKSFSDVKAVKTFIKFNPLSEEHLRICIEREINGVIEENDMMRVMANFNVSLDGCKGVFHKIRLLNIM